MAYPPIQSARKVQESKTGEVDQPSPRQGQQQQLLLTPRLPSSSSQKRQGCHQSPSLSSTSSKTPGSSRSRPNNRFGLRPANATNLIGLNGFLDDGSGNSAWNDAISLEMQQAQDARREAQLKKQLERQQYDVELHTQMKEAKNRKRSERQRTLVFDRQRSEQDQNDVLAMYQVTVARKWAEMQRCDHNLQQSLAWDKKKTEEAKRRANNSKEEHPWHFKEEVKQSTHVKDMKDSGKQDAKVYIAEFRRKKEAERSQEEIAKEEENQRIKAFKEQHEATMTDRAGKWQQRVSKLNKKAELVSQAQHNVEEEISARRKRELSPPSQHTPYIYAQDPKNVGYYSPEKLMEDWRLSEVQRVQKNAAAIEALDEVRRRKEADTKREKERQKAAIGQALEAMKRTAESDQMTQKVLQRMWKQDLLNQARSDAVLSQARAKEGFTDEQIKPQIRPSPRRAK